MEHFKVRNVDTGVICEVTRTPLGLIGNEGRYTLRWMDGIKIFVLEYSEEEFQDAMNSYLQRVEERKEEEMKLPSKFIFTHHILKDTVYSATLLEGGGAYELRWWSHSRREFTTDVYSAVAVERYVKEGIWVIDFDMTFEFLTEGLELVDDAPVMEDMSTYRVDDEPEFLPPDDIQGIEYDKIWIDELTDSDVSLAHIRRFTEETGAVVEICADLYTVYTGFEDRPLLAKTVDELTAIMQAVRVFRKAVDNG